MIPWTTACQASLSFTVSQSLLRFMSIESVIPSNHLILCYPLLLLLSIFPSIRSFPMTVLFALGGQSIGAFLRGGIRSVLGVHWKDWCWSWNSNTLATWCKELTYLKRQWCWERLRTGEEGDDRGWDGWMTSPTQWTRVWVDSGSWWWTGRPGVLWFMGSQRVGHDWVTELNWRENIW